MNSSKLTIAERLNLQEPEPVIPTKEELDAHIQANMQKIESVKEDTCGFCQKFKPMNTVSRYGMCNISGNMVMKNSDRCGRYRKNNHTPTSWAAQYD